MATVTIDLTCNLQKAVQVQYLNGNMFSADNAGNTINVYVMDGEEPATIGGSVSASVIRADGSTVAVSGALEGNRAYVILPQACYAVPGVISIVIKNTQNSTVTTIAALVANVYQSSTDVVVDPGTIIPSVQNLIAAIEAAVGSIPADYSSLWTSLAPAFSTSTAYTVGQYVTNNGGLYRFIADHAAGTWNSAHVVAANLGNDISALKGALNDLVPYNYSVTDNLYSPKFITNGYRLNIDTGDLDGNATHSVTDYIPVTAGEILYASRYASTQRIEIQSTFAPRICFYDAEKVFIENSGVQDSHATVPLSAKYMRFSAYNLPTIPDVMIGTTITPYIAFKTIADDYRVKTASLGTAISSAQNDITDIAYVDKTDSIGAELTWTSGYVTAGGNIHASDSYHYSELISVTPGDIISTGDSFRFVTAYVNGSAVESLGAESVTSYTVPDTVTAVIVTLDVSKTSVNHTYKVIFDGLAQHVKAIEEKIDGVTFNNDKTVVSAETDSLTNGQTLTACSDIDNKKGDRIFFYANLDSTSFESVTVGHGNNISYGASVTVDATKITTSYGTTADYYHVDHHLTIDKFLMIEVAHTDNGRASVRITTADGSCEIASTQVAWGGCKGDVFALSTNSTLSNVKLSCTFADFERDIFLFGDSYVGLGDNARWATVLISNGYTNLMIDGYGGRSSASAIVSFRKVIEMAKPKYVVWALGMNDADSESAINASYKECLDEVLETCETYGIIPIIATIPNVPERLHTYKNTYVKSLDCRIVDFADAVGAESEGSHWYNWGEAEAMLSSDEVHPTTYGAKALYSRFLIDVPEIANLP